MNDARGYQKRNPRIIREQEWSRWFNLHAWRHIETTYPRMVGWYRRQTRPLYLQRARADVPCSRAFPREDIQRACASRYFTCSTAWLIAYALRCAATRVELWGIELAKTQGDYAWERPCVFYWLHRARLAGLEVWWPSWLDWDLDSERASEDEARRYSGPLYGFSTRPDPRWDSERDCWRPEQPAGSVPSP